VSPSSECNDSSSLCFVLFLDAERKTYISLRGSCLSVCHNLAMGKTAERVVEMLSLAPFGPIILVFTRDSIML